MKAKNNISLSTIIASLFLMVSLSIIAVSCYFIYIENVKFKNLNLNKENINQLAKLNMNWSSSVEETRNFSLRDFDKIALYTKQIRAKLAELDDSGLLNKEEVGAETVSEYRIFKSSFEVKYEAIERYKSEQAVLRNSANFCHHSASDALANIKNKEVRDNINKTSSLMSTFLLLNDEQSSQEAKSQFDYLQSINYEDESSRGKEAIKIFISHAKIILEYKPRVNSMLEAAQDVDIDTLTKNVSSAYQNYYGLSVDRVNNWKKLILIGLVLLFFSFIWFLKKFRQGSKLAFFMQEKLYEVNNKIDHVSEDILHVERFSGRGSLALATINSIQKKVSITKNIQFLQSIIDTENNQVNSSEVEEIISELKFQNNEIYKLNKAINSERNRSGNLFNLNELIRKAIVVVESDSELPNIKLQLGRDIPQTVNSPVDVFLIILKLLRLLPTQNEGQVFIKTWSSDTFINMYIHIDGNDSIEEIYSGKLISVVKELIFKNNLSLDVLDQQNNKSAVKFKIPIRKP